MFCASCGAEISQDARFCPKCGSSRSSGNESLVPTGPEAPVFRQRPTPAAPEIIYLNQPSARPASKNTESNSASIAAWILLVFACAGALIPGLGFAMWIIIAPILLITLVLGVMEISKGSTVNGVMIVLASLIVVPLIVFLAPIITTSALGGAASGASDYLQNQQVENSVADHQVEPSESDSQQYTHSVIEPAYDYNHDASAPVDDQVHQDATASSNNDPNVVKQSTHDAQRAETRQPIATPATTSASMQVSTSKGYAVLRTKPSMFSKGLGRLENGTTVVLSETQTVEDWVLVSTADGRAGFVGRDELTD